MEPNFNFHVIFTAYCVRILDNKVTGYTPEEHRAALAMKEVDDHAQEWKNVWDVESSLRRAA